ncbi:hypothetical protein, partial [Bradyrhizobium japonicum]|uniref:hypothetical protein n=1 Tax=Bradyrhizobium japonicum TaxID=375 RepID=UPI001AF0007A
QPCRSTGASSIVWIATRQMLMSFANGEHVIAIDEYRGRLCHVSTNISREAAEFKLPEGELSTSVNN